MTQEHLKDIDMGEEPVKTMSMNPKKFMLWLAIASITMMFAGWTSGYLVRKAEGNWHEFDLPNIFLYSTAVLVVSSVFMHLAVRAAKKDNFNTLKIAISITFAFGMAFLFMQWYGFSDLVKNQLHFSGSDVAASWIYVFVGIHGLHIISGLVVLLFSLVSSFRLSINANNLTRIQLCATYWHFLDGLWLYLFFFLYFNR
ncbi:MULTISPECIES: cytochrome c oxidase subunit 3 [Flectobacillus]|uniref:Cytochrome c oxidase subunit 3 n=1 Tax=Flectobacillus roseus TaxID=502259 RepID=A0ABT6Y9U0_9BACT|nr:MULTISPECIES: cytochrome c oxidase subunit 3 [Flectobacillus]MDI9860310.1 cytochrome c oxidase subunit 3 [Flectobacillus roseus]